MAQSISLSSAGTATIVLNPVVKSTTVAASVTATSSGVFQIEVSLDDPTIPGGPTATWAVLSSAAAMVSSTVLSSAGNNGAVLYTVLSPVGMVRLNSTTWGAGSATLKALQSITA
jgi:hypothetical protein